MGKNRKIGYKVRCGTFFWDLCITIDKTDKESIYLLFSRKYNWKRRREFKRMISSTLSKSTFVWVKKLCFICNEYRESDSNACNFGDLTRGCKEGVRCKLLDRINSFLQEPTKKFHEAATRLIKENRIRTWWRFCCRYVLPWFHLY